MYMLIRKEARSGNFIDRVERGFHHLKLGSPYFPTCNKKPTDTLLGQRYNVCLHCILYDIYCTKDILNNVYQFLSFFGYSKTKYKPQTTSTVSVKFDVAL